MLLSSDVAGKENKAEEMTVSWSVFTTSSLAEFGWSVWATEAASLSWTDGPGSSGQCLAAVHIAEVWEVNKEDPFPIDLGKGISILGGVEAPSPQWHLKGVGWEEERVEVTWEQSVARGPSIHLNWVTALSLTKENLLRACLMLICSGKCSFPKLGLLSRVTLADGKDWGPLHMISRHHRCPSQSILEMTFPRLGGVRLSSGCQHRYLPASKGGRWVPQRSGSEHRLWT